MYLTKSADKEWFNSRCIFIVCFLSFYENDSAVLTEKRFFFTTSMFADRYFGFLPLHEKANKRMRASLNQLLN